MTEVTRRRILTYGIAIDLVIVATGIGMLMPAAPAVLVGAYVLAAALSAWKARWNGAVTAMTLSILAFVLVFPEIATTGRVAALAGASLLASAGVIVALDPRMRFSTAPAPTAVDDDEEELSARLDAFRREAEEARREAEERAGREREEAARAAAAAAEARVETQRHEAEAAAAAEAQRRAEEEAARLESERLAAEQAARDAQPLVAPLVAKTAEKPRRRSTKRDRADEERRAREERERLEAERVAALEAERARLEQEREAALRAEEEARQRADEERRAREERERLEAERVAALEAERERLAQEREAALRAEEEARQRADEERRAREERERIEAERVAALEAERARLAQELAEREAREREAAERAEALARAEEEARQRAEEERRAREERERIEAERVAALEAERARLAQELAEREAREREAAERAEALARAEEAARQRAEEERRAREERERIEAERVAALEAERARLAQELADREAREREAAERAEALARAEEEARQRAEEERRAREEREQIEAERVAALEAERARLLAEREAALDAERKRLEEELAARVASEREAVQRELQERLQAELEQKLAAEREALRAEVDQQVAVQREEIERAATERVEAARRSAEEATAPAARSASRGGNGAPKSSLFDAVAGWFKREPQPSRTVNLARKSTAATPAARSSSAASSTATSRKSTAAANARKPRLLLLERRRATADTVVPKLRQRGVDVEVVERWVDAVDELFRFRPDAMFLDIEHPDFEKIHRTIAEKSPKLPIVLTGRSAAHAPASTRYAAFVARPYELDDIMKVAQHAFTKPEELLAEQMIPRVAKPSTPPQRVAQPQRPAAPQRPAPPPAAHAHAPVHVPQGVPRPAPPEDEELQEAVAAAPSRAASNDAYEVVCFSCRANYDAVEADWCSCLTKERTLVCTNCLACFCKAPPAYKEKFWVEAPPRLFERKTTEARRQGTMPDNPAPEEVIRPLVLVVEDDEEIQAIVQRVCSNLGYGFVYAMNGQDGLNVARLYKPNLILSDAFMPKLDGREMCRMLKEEGADCKMVVMTGLYTDTKYRSEAVKRFHVDDYIAKPVAITDLINLLQRHLEGITGLPSQEDLHELHRKEIEEEEPAPLAEHDEVQLAAVLPMPQVDRAGRSRRGDSYDVGCYNCQATFDASRAEWCSCVGRDNTLVCEHCGGCFCKAPAAYKERFWVDAPSSLFERKMIGSKRTHGARTNPEPREIKRPLILLVEDDENVQLIVRTVVTSMGYGFVVGANGQEGLALAREYNPDLILSDAFMPKLDGREMCRLLKEDPVTARAKAIIMTGLYTDRKYRNEALDYFKVDDYVAKPLAVDDLIKLFKKHLPQEVQSAM